MGAFRREASVGDLDGIVDEFIVESHESLDRLDDDLVQLEADPGATDLLDGVFRAVHTIKGTSGFLAFTVLEAVSHSGENLLARLRSGDLMVTQARIDALLHLLDVTRAMLERIEQTGSDAGYEVQPIMACLNSVLGDDEVTIAGAVAPDTATVAVPSPASSPESSRELSPAISTAPTPAPEVLESLVRESSVRASSVRVDIAVLDTLMRLVGELVVTRNQLVRQAHVDADSVAVATALRLNLITTELQESVMRARLQPVGQVWATLPRVVRDVSLACGKQVDLVVEGRDTEVDRALLDAVRDPLVHLVRNAVDHGIESPAVRVAAGKPPRGTVTLRAGHVVGEIVLDIVDDGAGISRTAIAARALDQGLVSAADLDRLTQDEVLDLIFRPGFSTAAAVTTVSGRGVGLDVVRAGLERVGGTVEVHTTLGQGSRIRLRAPLTLAIAATLIVTQAGLPYALGLTHVLDLVDVDPAAERMPVELVAGAPMHRWRGSLVPVLDLGVVFGGPSTVPDDAPRLLVVVSAGGAVVGLLVDDVVDTQEIVVKPLAGPLRTLDVFSGAAVLGDGQIALVLDLARVADRHGLRAPISTGIQPNNPAIPAQRSITRHVPVPDDEFVVVTVRSDDRVAIALSLVERLAEVASSDIDRVGDSLVVRLGAEAVLLIDLTGGAPIDPHAAVVVCRLRGQRVALRVLAVVDIVESARSEGAWPGAPAHILTDERVIEVVDVDRLVSEAAGVHA